ncbi:hypothetical protein J2793_000040 [Paraburkholderia caledonica]|uniref:Uncharacterized protein n=1 Tax=Paraburkholderia caledonica TaxID=134536 RepID=A0AB73I3N7_9BURK|nr:hypothetical protein [Paraburkholderia caledonica]
MDAHSTIGRLAGQTCAAPPIEPATPTPPHRTSPPPLDFKRNNPQPKPTSSPSHKPFR